MRKFFSLLKNRKYRALMPLMPRHDDVYLVEFPKSGITWLGFLIGNTQLQLAKLDREMTLYNTGQYIPDIHVSRDLPWVTFDQLGFRFIKSHSSFNPFYNQVIYLIRQPWDVMDSYYSFMTAFGYSKSYAHFIRDKQLGIDKWVAHVEGWLDRGNSAQRIHLVNYADLKKNPLPILEKIYRNLGMTIETSILQKSIALSSFEYMKQSEFFYKQHNPNYNIDFIRKGKMTARNENEIDPFLLKKVEHLQKFFLSSAESTV